MISSLRGILLKKDFDSMHIDVNGVGYQLRIPSCTYNRLPEINENLMIYSKMIVRENDISLYGFSEEDDRDAFSVFIEIPSIGPRTALAILDTFPLVDLATALIKDDPQLLTKIPGIGKKTATKLAIELKDRFDKLFKDNLKNRIKLPANKELPKGEETIRQALRSLGFSNIEIDKRLLEIERPENASVEQMITLFLKKSGERN